MRPRFKMAAALASLVAVTFTLRCLWLWQPQRQLMLHQAHFRDAIEHRDWSRLSGFIDPAYSDRWGYTHETGLRDARQWLGQFFALTITSDPVSSRLTPGGGIVIERWKFDGAGIAASSMVQDSVNSLHAPFLFEWKHAGWKPWHWTLVRVDNAGLDLSPPEP